jgi:large subunit ribosomal protein L21
MPSQDWEFHGGETHRTGGFRCFAVRTATPLAQSRPYLLNLVVCQKYAISYQDSAMYAIISEGGRQFKVEEGQEFDIDYRDLATGDQVTFDRVLAYRNDAEFKLGQPILEGASVTAEVLSVAQGPKLVVQKYRRRKNYRRKTGHRQLYTRVKINKIIVG